MRMMRLLYRLGIGSQERKQERLMMFSKSVSSLQNKAREQKYKDIQQSNEDKIKLANKIIKNTYRTLMTRGMKGCYVYCVDKGLADYLRECLKNKKGNDK